MEDRRKFLKTGLGVLLGAAGVGLARPAVLRADASPNQYVMIIDLNKCNGCDSCVIACKTRNRTAKGRFLTRVDPVESGKYPKTTMHFVPAQCNQCEDPPSAIAFRPVPMKPDSWTSASATDVWPHARKRLPTSWETESSLPTGTAARAADKCDFCLDRLERGLGFYGLYLGQLKDLVPGGS